MKLTINFGKNHNHLNSFQIDNNLIINLEKNVNDRHNISGF